jgi:hypothetical protein
MSKMSKTSKTNEIKSKISEDIEEVSAVKPELGLEPVCQKVLIDTIYVILQLCVY